MCYLHYQPENWGDDVPSPGPRPLPRLAWALPVDVVELGSSLESFESQLEQITTLRLCHRFGHGPLSTLPQEILDIIISRAHESMKASLRGKWELDYLCFQGRCVGRHFCERREFDNQDSNEAAIIFGTIRPSENLADYPEEESMMLAGELFEESDFDVFADELTWDIHRVRQRAWLDQLCLCRKESSAPHAGPGFILLHKLLKSHFGVSAIIQHEVLSDDLMWFLPYAKSYSDCAYYTSCFLAWSSPEQIECSTTGRTATHRNDAYLSTSNHLAYQKVIQPSEFVITEEQKTRFARAMRLLGLEPDYRITELESTIAGSKDDEKLWAICDRQLPDSPQNQLRAAFEETEHAHRLSPWQEERTFAASVASADADVYIRCCCPFQFRLSRSTSVGGQSWGA